MLFDCCRQHIEKDAAFERRFQQVYVGEPTVPDTIQILRGLKEKYEVSLIPGTQPPSYSY
jgi:ATP-dependent Clp protease ATP-binding subunit ClpA